MTEINQGPLEVTSYFRKTTEGSEVTFTVTGEGAFSAQGLKLEVKNPNGKKVFSSKTSRTFLTWDTTGVANGVYLYIGSVKTEGEFKRTNIGKVLVLN